MSATTARCYCGATTLVAGPVQTVAWCHCSDCRRWTGAPMPAFAAVATESLRMEPEVREVSSHPGVWRRNCPVCGSPMTARFDYLPEQVYIPVGVLDDAAAHAPEIHCHAASRLPWVPIHDGLPREEGSARTTLAESAE